MTTSAAERLTAAIADAGDGFVLVVTGAGISRASGIETFRGPEPEAVWKQHDLEKATFDYFLRDPVGQWRWYLQRFRKVDAARPNPAHRALAEIERWQTERGGGFLVVTQNIDTLHEQAGSERLIKVHGTSDRLRCSRPGCELGSPRGSLPRTEVDLEPFLRELSRETLPLCPRCSAVLRAHVLFFDEYYQEHADYRFEEAIEAADEAAVVVFSGTSFSVGITDLVLRAAWRRGAPAFSIDPHAAGAAGWPRIARLAEPAEELLPEVSRALAAPGPA